MKKNADAFNQAVAIPFSCEVKQRITDVVKFKQNLNEDETYVHVICHAVTSPDEKMLVFNAQHLCNGITRIRHNLYN